MLCNSLLCINKSFEKTFEKTLVVIRKQLKVILVWLLTISKTSNDIHLIWFTRFKCYFLFNNSVMLIIVSIQLFNFTFLLMFSMFLWSFSLLANKVDGRMWKLILYTVVQTMDHGASSKVNLISPVYYLMNMIIVL